MTISERRFLPLWNIKKKQYYEGKKPVELGGGGGGVGGGEDFKIRLSYISYRSDFAISVFSQSVWIFSFLGLDGFRNCRVLDNISVIWSQ